MLKKNSTKSLKTDTLITHAGRHPRDFHGFVNPPVVHASTVLFPNTAAMNSGDALYKYGRRGTPTTNALEEAVADLEGATGAKLANSGLNAIALACLSCLKAGDHFLIVDTAYGPTRHFADTVLPGFGIDVEYYDPALGGAITTLFRDNTAAVFTEAPGSLSFEMQDIRATADAAKSIDATVLMDNTWASPLYCKPLELGVDLSIQAGTKYIVGHSDVMIGTVAASASHFDRLLATHGAMGIHVGPEDVYLALRGLRTLSVRLERHWQNALAVSKWLSSRPEVANIHYPALETDPGHDLWKRDFAGASGLFAFDLAATVSKEQMHAILDGLSLFGLGYSWGGFESLAIPVNLGGMRTATKVDDNQCSIRLHIGLEDPEDLIADLGSAMDAALT